MRLIDFTLNFLLFYGLLTLSSISISQVQLYPFNSQTDYNAWNPLSTNSPMPFSFNSGAQAIKYTENTEEYEQLLSSQLLKTQIPYQLIDNFRVSFKVRKQLLSSSNSYFPLLLTQNVLTGTHQHPWRLGPYANPTLGNQQNVALLGVIFTHNTIGFVHRQHQSSSGQISYLNNFSLPSNTDLWIRIEKHCSGGYKLSVFNVPTMDNTPMAEQTFNYSSLSVPLGALYIANCNGNGTLTEHNDLLDDYKIELIPDAIINFDYTINPPSCDEPGLIQVTNISGGTAPYLVSFNGSTPSSPTTFDFTTEDEVLISVYENSGCSGQASVDLSDIGGTGTVSFPNVFTPDKDGINDKWFASGSCIRNFNCTILNRWGIPMQTLTAIDQEWNGMSEGENCSTGVYFYTSIVEYTSGIKEEFHGFITLTR